MALRTHRTAVRAIKGSFWNQKRFRNNSGPVKRRRERRCIATFTVLSDYQEITLRECHEELTWLTRSLRELLNALGIPKKASPGEVVACFKELDENFFRNYAPVAQLYSNGVEKFQWCVKKVADGYLLCAELVFHSGHHLNIIGSSAEFLKCS